jgi:hypothetical protein
LVNGRAATRCFPALLFADDSRTTSPARVYSQIGWLRLGEVARPARFGA